MPRVPVALLLVPLTLCAIPAWSQSRQPPRESISRTFHISGTLRSNDDSRPLEMVKVELKKLTGETVGTSFTRSNGEFEFAGLTNGMYYVVVDEKGYEPIREGVEILNGSRSGVFLFLRRPLEASINTTAPGNSVSARELSLPQKDQEAMRKGRERLFGKNDPKGSVAQFQRVLADVPSYYEGYHMLGVAQILMGNTADGEKSLRKAIELSDNKYAPANIDLAALLSNNQRYSEAEPVARRSVELDATVWQAHYELARALMGVNRVDAAEKSAQEARTRKPDFAQLHLIMANIHIRKHNYPALLADLDTYLKLDPNGPMSDQARQMRTKVQQALANAQNTTSPPTSKP